MTIIITGASGNFGRCAAELLLETIPPGDLVLVSRTPDKLSDLATRGCIVRHGDFDDPASLVAAFEGGDRLLLISGTRVGKRIPQHGAAIDAARQAGMRHIVYTSFIAADDPANLSEAVKDHRATEEMLRDSGLAWTALRDAQYADAVTDVIIHSLIKDGVMQSAAGDGKMPFIWRDDCVVAAVATLLGEGHENKAYDLTGPDMISHRDIAALAAEFFGHPVEYRQISPEALYAIFDALGVPRQPVDNFVASGNPWNSDDMVSFDVAVRDGHFAVESTDFEQLTGRKPRSLRALFEAKADEIRAVHAMATRTGA